jgi:aspartate-semialdehyde dehydrogenase
MGGHSESVNMEFEHVPNMQEVRAALQSFSGVVVLDEPLNFEYPMPLIHAHNSDNVFVGRIRRDESNEHAINCWIVSDNLRKGAATNAVQIANHLLKRGLLET